MYGKVEMRIVIADGDDYNPARVRPEEITEEYTADAVIYSSNIEVPASPSSIDLGDGEYTEVIVYNRDDTNFITATWLNDDTSSGQAQIPAGRSLKLPWINGGGSTHLNLSSDTAACRADIYYGG